MISQLLKAVMRELKLSQADLADVLDVPLHRVKSLTTDKVKNLRREEGEALITKLRIRGDWLATGEGPMLQSAQERELHRRLDAVRSTSEKIHAAGLDAATAGALQELLYYAELGDMVSLTKLLQDMPRLSAEEQTLVRYFREAPAEIQRRVMAALLGVAQLGGSQHNSGAHAVQVGQAGGAVKVKTKGR